MPSKFDSKSFNAEAFKYMVGRVPNLKMNEMKKSRALSGNADIKSVFSSQDGTAYAKIAMRGLADGDAVNYDGNTDIEATSTKTFEQGVVVVGRAKGWIERDFSQDITGGVDFMGNIAQQIAEYKDGLDQDTLLAVLEGIFSMNDGGKSSEFVAKHTFDISGEAVDNKVGPVTLNTAINKACGANKKKFSMVFMHSDVATNLENLNLLQHLKYTDKDGIQRDLALGTWNGRTVIIDDSMPLVKSVTTEGVNGVYTLSILTQGVVGDKITVDGVEYTFANSSSKPDRTIAVGSTIANQATSLKAQLADQLADKFSVSLSGSNIVLTQLVAGTGAIPVVSTTGTVRANIAETVAGIAESSRTAYVTYVLGDGAISFEDIGAKVPYEMHRDPKTNGGQDTLYIRQRKCFAPFGISYEKVSQASNSPTNSELSDGSNWALVHSGESDVADRTYINHKAIAIARIISLG